MHRHDHRGWFKSLELALPPRCLSHHSHLPILKFPSTQQTYIQFAPEPYSNSPPVQPSDLPSFIASGGQRVPLSQPCSLPASSSLHPASSQQVLSKFTQPQLTESHSHSRHSTTTRPAQQLTRIWSLRRFKTLLVRPLIIAQFGYCFWANNTSFTVSFPAWKLPGELGFKCRRGDGGWKH